MFKIPKMTQRQINNFWKKVNIKSNNECWAWTASIAGSGKGYGFFNLQNNFVKHGFRAHRIAYYLWYKIDPFPNHVLHNCDNTHCVNPNHLFLGTHAENMKDMSLKGRSPKGIRSGHYTKPESTRRGSQVHWAKLKEDQVREIKSRHIVTPKDYFSIASEFGVNVGTIRDIFARRHWKHI